MQTQRTLNWARVESGKGNVSFYYDISVLDALCLSISLSLPRILFLPCLLILFCRKLFVFNAYYYYGFVSFHRLELNGRNCPIRPQTVLRQKCDGENVNWLLLDPSKCNNSTININVTVDDESKTKWYKLSIAL